MPVAMTVLNGKGGAGTTSLAVNLAVIAASTGWRTLTVDTDRQGSSLNRGGMTGVPTIVVSLLRCWLSWGCVVDGTASAHGATAQASVIAPLPTASRREHAGRGLVAGGSVLTADLGSKEGRCRQRLSATL